MTKQEIINAATMATGYSEFAVKAVVEAAIEEVTQSLKKGRNVRIRNFGQFKVVERAPRFVRNIKTGESFYTQRRKAVTFEPGKNLKNI